MRVFESITRFCISVSCVLLLNLGVNPSASASPNAGPTISTITIQTPGSIEKYAKFEIAFGISNTSATNFYFPYAATTPPNVPSRTGISVDALLLPPGETNWNNARLVPCFYYQPVEQVGSGDNAALLPVGKPDWRCRFTPDVVGIWNYRIRATDANGTTTTGDNSFTCIYSNRKGFIKISSTDSRYFAWSDGTPFHTPLINVEDGNPFNGLSKLRANIQKWGENSVRFVRWFPTGEGANFDVIPFGDNMRSSWAFGDAWLNANDPDVAINRQSSFSPYYYTSQSLPALPGAKYRLSFRAKVTGSKVFHPQIVGDGATLGELAITANGAWTSYTLDVTNRNNAQKLFVYLHDGYSENDNNAGSITLNSIMLQRDENGAGDWGANLLRRSDPDTYKYIDQRGAALLDEIMRLSEQSGVYHKLPLFNKNDDLLDRFMPDGTLGEWDSINNNFYSQNGGTSRWYQNAYVRYFIARWSYSPALHSLELANENMLTQPSYDAGFAFGDYVLRNSPRHVLMSNSFWGWFVSEYWTDPQRGYLMDYADKHWYANPSGSGGGEMISTTTNDSALNVRECWKRFNQYRQDFNYTKPIVRGETGVASSGTQPQNADIAKDPHGTYYHKKLWAHVGAVGYQCDGEWYPDVLEQNNLWGLYAAYARFMQDESIANGRYQAIGTDLSGSQQINVSASTPNLRAWGARDFAAGRVIVWIDNAKDTWRNVVDKVSIPPASGTLTIHGLPIGKYTAQRWNTTTGTITASETYSVNASGDLMFSVSQLTNDQAIRFVPAGQPIFISQKTFLPLIKR